MSPWAAPRGCRETAVMFCYAARNAMLPVLTNLALMLGAVFGGSIVTEIVFNYPGLGLTLFTASVARDYPVIQGQLLLMTLATLGANLLVDIIYGCRRPAHPGGAAHELGLTIASGGRRRRWSASPSSSRCALMALSGAADRAQRSGRARRPLAPAADGRALFRHHQDGPRRLFASSSGARVRRSPSASRPACSSPRSAP